MTASRVRDRAEPPCGRDSRRRGDWGGLMAVWSACGQDNPDGGKYCAECGAMLAEPAQRDLKHEQVIELFCSQVSEAHRSALRFVKR